MQFAEYVLRATSKRELLISLALAIPADNLEELERYKEQRGLDMLVIPRTGEPLNRGTLKVSSAKPSINGYYQITLPDRVGYFYVYGPHTASVTQEEIEISEDTFLKRNPGEFIQDEQSADEMMTTAIKAFDIGYRKRIVGSRDKVARDGIREIRDAFGRMLGRTVHLFDYLNDLEQKIEGRANADIARMTRFFVTPGYSWEQQGGLKKAADEGFQEMRRVAALDDRSCDDCVRWDSMGWQPIETVPPPGEGCQCLDRCRCVLEYRER